MLKFKNIVLLCSLFLLVSCASTLKEFETVYGPSEPRNRILPKDHVTSPLDISFSKQVQPILNNRCVVCHACNDAPCQLNLTSIEGIDRGANELPVYNGGRILTQKPTRLGIDAISTADWRKKDFYPVLNERNPGAVAHLNNSLLYQMLRLKSEDEFPTEGRLSKAYDVGTKLRTDVESLLHQQQCSRIEDFADFADDNPHWGMPFAFPPLRNDEFSTIEDWLLQGAMAEAKKPLSAAQEHRVLTWENFFNGSSNKEKLMARYVYEHIYLGHLYFDEISPKQYFTLVRSRTPSGEPIDNIVSLRPYDNPGVDKFYYRLQRFDRTIVSKTHMPYALNKARLARITELFLDAKYEVAELPTYEAKPSANPFKTFAAIPPKNRYLFMLDEAQFIISGFIKGPVCRGSIALSVIDDHFWVAFMDPDTNPVSYDSRFLTKVSDDLRIPSEKEENMSLYGAWNAYYKVAVKYFSAKIEYAREMFPEGREYDLRQIWDGDKHNQNAALTVYRHVDSASVVQGFVGEIPKTGWILDYPLLERIHYLLVAGYNVYGTVGHQLATRMYMDYLRIESEVNFLSFMPHETAIELHKHWYRETDATEQLVKLIDGLSGKAFNTNIEYTTDDPKTEFFIMLSQHLQSAQKSVDSINLCSQFPIECASLPLDEQTTKIELQMRRISDLGGELTDVFSNVTFVRVIVDGSLQNDKVYSFVRNKSYLNTSSLVASEKMRVKSEDTIDVVKGFVGEYPNFFIEVKLENLKAFVDEYEDIIGYESYHRLIDKYGVRRSNPDFWQSADWFHAKFELEDPKFAGIFDLNRYQNR